MKNPILTIILIVVTLTKINSQGIIINEISNGTSGTKEFIEFLVVGSHAQPIGLVSLRNWVFDDNNGDFEASTGTGVAAGHYRFTALLPPIPIGSLIVVYNSSDVNLSRSRSMGSDSIGSRVSTQSILRGSSFFFFFLSGNFFPGGLPFGFFLICIPSSV